MPAQVGALGENASKVLGQALEVAFAALGWKVRRAFTDPGPAIVTELVHDERPDFVVEYRNEHGDSGRLVLEVKSVQQVAGSSAAPSVSESVYQAKFLMALIDKLTARLDGLAVSGHDLTGLGDPDELAELLVKRMPLTPSPLEELAGPFYDTPSLCRWLDKSRQALDARVRAHTLLGLPVHEGPRVYPVWQFTDSGETIPHLADVLRTLAEGNSDPWTWALWLSAPDDEYDGLTAWQWLNHEQDPAVILRDARSDANRWAS